MKITNNVQVEDIDLNETILKGVREYLKRLVVKQVIIAFDQAKKKVQDLRQRTKEGMAVAKAKGSKIGREKGLTFETKKSKEIKEKIQKFSKDFNGILKDAKLIKLLKIAINSYYKYKKEIFLEKCELRKI